MPIEALRAAFATGGGKAVLEILEQHFTVTFETIEALGEDHVDFADGGILAGLDLTMKRVRSLSLRYELLCCYAIIKRGPDGYHYDRRLDDELDTVWCALEDAKCAKSAQ